MVITRDAVPGVIVQTEGALAVALDTTLTDELRSEGMARELVSRVQQLRREAGFDVTNRVTVTWQSEDPLIVEAFRTHHAAIASEVLATAITEGEAGTASDIDGHALSLDVERVA